MKQILSLITAVAALSAPWAHCEEAETFGIITGLAGEVFSVNGNAKKITRPGQALMVGQSILIKEDSEIVWVDRNGNEFTAVGLAELEFVSTSSVEVSKGIVKIKSSSNAVEVRTAALAATVAGEGAVWITPEKSQWFTLTGVATAWHPAHPNSRIEVKGGYFTETSSSSAHYLEPRRPKVVDAGAANDFLANFSEPNLHFDKISPPPVVALPDPMLEKKPKRDLASVLKAARAGPRPEATPIPVRREMLERLKAHIEGREYDEEAVRRERAKKVIDPETQKRLAEEAKRKAQIAKREAAFSKILAETPYPAAPKPAKDVGNDRKPASMVGPDGRPREAAPKISLTQEELMGTDPKPTIIQRLIQKKDHKHE